MEISDTPYKDLGEELSKIRKRLQESVAEVSGAVEIDSDKLALFEEGKKRPSEDILELLITHFNVKDHEASRLWKLAGYDELKINTDSEELPMIPQPIMLLPFDARIIYTDVMNVVINNNGVVLNFMQNTGLNNQQMPAARVGMSLEHARLVAKTLEQTIKAATESTEQKNLPAPKNRKDSRGK
jgi:transcriptional regulator with XRE-family HTH domain